MSGSAKFKFVPIIDVTKENVAVVRPIVRGAIIGADFIAIDCELSGLGNRRLVNASDIQERYQNTCGVAKTRSIISFGLSMFKLFKDSENSESDFNYHVQTFNIVTLCSEDYIVEPSSLQFLVQHGFDFNKQYSQGLPYFRGDDKVKSGAGEEFVRQTFFEIVRNKKPIVLHNGFIDLVFLYQNFYAQLPQTINSFSADLDEMFPLGIYDTKYISDYVCRKPSSFLEYIFRSQQRKNIVNANGGKCPYVTLAFPNYAISNQHVQYRGCDFAPLFEPMRKELTLCSSFADHGHCPNGKACPNSHDIDLVILTKEANSNGKNDRKRKRPSPPSSDKPDSNSSKKRGSPPNVGPPVEVVGCESGYDTTKETSEESRVSPEVKGNVISGAHRAGFDAFMTGFAFATYLVHNTNTEKHSTEPQSRLLGVPIQPQFADFNIVNRIYLVCKDAPFMVRKSAYTRNSAGHARKASKIANI